MRKTLIVCGMVIAAVFAGVMFFSANRPPATSQPAEKGDARAETVKPPAAAPVPVSRSGPIARPVSSDPRLAALMVSPDNGLIEFVPDSNGKVIKEIDNDPNSLGYRKPLREYSYAGERVVRLVSYHYLGNQVQIVQADVSYKPDGSVDHYREATSYNGQ